MSADPSHKNECLRHDRREPNASGWCQPICHHRGNRFIVVSEIRRAGHMWFLDIVEEDEHGEVLNVDQLAAGDWSIEPWEPHWQRALAVLREPPTHGATEGEDS